MLQLDTASSSKGTILRQVHLDKALEKVLAAAKERCPFVGDDWFHRVTGDSAVLAAPSRVPKSVIAADFVRELRTALRNFNAMMNDAGRLRVRLAIDHGDVIRHGEHINGAAVVRAARLCESETLRDVLRRNNGVDLAVVLTEAFYGDAVEGGRDVDPAEFTFMHDRVKDREVSGWLWLPGNGKRGGASKPYAAPSGPRSEPRPQPGPSTYIRSVTSHGPSVIGSGNSQTVHNYGPQTTRPPRDRATGEADD
ncbi:hypothetical protein [Lentzea sp.]|uniref:hypothetical protein n=1 Tax=Lentzea sp. TaxID=56099 RepID=UPI002ED0D551